MIKTGGWLRVGLPAGPSYFDLKDICHFYQKKKDTHHWNGLLLLLFSCFSREDWLLTILFLSSRILALYSNVATNPSN